MRSNSHATLNSNQRVMQSESLPDDTAASLDSTPLPFDKEDRSTEAKGLRLKRPTLPTTPGSRNRLAHTSLSYLGVISEFRQRIGQHGFSEFVHWSTAVVCIWTLMLMGAPLSAEEPTPSAEVIHEFMVFRDMQLNNMTVEYTKTGSEFIDAKDLDFLDSPEDVPDEIPFRRRERFVIRNHEFTFFSDTPDDFDGEDESGYRLTPHRRWTNRSGHVVEVLENDPNANADSKGNAIVTHLPEAHSFGGSNQFLWPIELSLGIGFGKRTESFTIKSHDQGLFTCECILSTSDVEKTQCEFTMDSDYIVRRARLEVGNKLRSYVYEIETEGLLQVGDFKCARTGSFSSVIQTRQEDGTITEKPNRKFTLSEVNIESNLSDNEYESATEFEIPEGAQIDDPHGLLAVPPKSNFILPLILANVVLAALVCFFLLKRRMRGSRV